MDYKDYIHEELENGNVRFMAHVCVDIEVSKEECERLLNQKTSNQIGNLLKEWIEKGYVKTTSHGDSYFTDKMGDLGNRAYFDFSMGQKKENEITNYIDAVWNTKEAKQRLINELCIDMSDGEYFAEELMEEVRKGFVAGLSPEQIKVYAKDEFIQSQMNEIRLGFEHGLSMEEVLLYAKSDLTIWQMAEIRKGFEAGLTMEQVFSYADKKFSYSKMQSKRELLENKIKLSIDEKINQVKPDKKKKCASSKELTL